LLRGNSVGFKASKFIFQAPLLVLCSRKRRVPRRERDTHGGGIKPEQAPLLNHIPIPSTEQGASINPVCIRRRRQLPKKTTTTVFVRVGKFRDSSLFRIFILIPTGSCGTGIIFDHAGPIHVGLIRIILWSQPTTYFEDNYLLRSL